MSQMNLFDFGYSEQLKEDKPTRIIRMLSLFSGIGAFEKAMQNLGWKLLIVNYCEVDKFASKGR